MALDYGTKSIGVALSDELQLTARPLTTIHRNKLKFAQVLAKIGDLIGEYEIGTLVVGLPLNMDGSHGPATSRVKSFLAELRRHVTTPIVTQDERLTSIEADYLLREQGANQRERRAKSDEYAALVILRDYLATQSQSHTHSI